MTDPAARGRAEAQPLTAEEEARLREQIVDLAEFPTHGIWVSTVGALLATLDRERAAAPTPKPGAEGLREALRVAVAVAVHEWLDPECSGAPPYGATQRQADDITEAVMRSPIVLATLTQRPPREYSRGVGIAKKVRP